MFSKTTKAIIITLALILFSAALIGCSRYYCNGHIMGNGNLKDYTFSHEGSIKKIEVNLPVTLNITSESNNEVTYSIEENLNDMLDIKYSNGVLKINGKHYRSFENKKDITFNICSDTLEEIVIDGLATINGTITAKTFKLKAFGDIKGELTFNAKNVYIKADGMADLTLSGKATEFNLNVMGEVKGEFTFDAERMNIKGDGMGKLTLFGKVTELNIDIMGEIKITNKTTK